VSVRSGPRPAVLALVALGLLLLAAWGPAPARAADCLTADPPPVTAAAHALRFGITPALAGNTGTGQGEAAPEDPAKTLTALEDLAPDRRLVLRLNRLFWSEGRAGIDRFAAMVDRYAAAGFSSEIQVRYHPPEGHAGDMAGWTSFVRAAVRELARRPAVVAMSITNEGNFPGSPNTSDGAYAGIEEAVVTGIVAARQEARAIGRPDLPLGFTVMWRWEPESDEQFWEEIGRLGTPLFRRSLTYVGVQAYPGLVWPPAPIPGRSAGEEMVEALTLVRHCHMPKARLGAGVALWVTENGYATNLGRSESEQARDLRSTVEAVHAWSGTLGVTDYRYFNLRDNDSTGTDLFDAVGLLRDDYTRKPSFFTYRSLTRSFGTPLP
jgi:hypothetical protein